MIMITDVFSKIEPDLNDITQLHDILTDIEETDLFRETQDDVRKKLTDLKKHSISCMQAELDKASGRVPVRVALIGNFGAGKSSVINSLLGAKVCPVKLKPTTSSVTRFHYGDTPEIHMTMGDDLPSKIITPEEYQVAVRHKDGQGDETKCCEFDYFYPFNAFRDLILIDTPGFANSDKGADESITYGVLQTADIVLYVLDIENGTPTADELKRLNEIKEKYSKPCSLILNKADRKPPPARKRIKAEIDDKHPKQFKNTYLYSAKKILEHRGVSLCDAIPALIEHINQQATIEYANRQATDNKLFDIQLHCNPDPKSGKVKVIFDGMVTTRNDTYNASRKELLEYLESLGRDKKKIIAARFKEKRTSYRRRKTGLLKKLRSKLEDLQSKGISKDEETYNSYIQQCVEIEENWRMEIIEEASRKLDASTRVKLSKKNIICANTYRITSPTAMRKIESINSKQCLAALSLLTREIHQDLGADFLDSGWSKELIIAFQKDAKTEVKNWHDTLKNTIKDSNEQEMDEKTARKNKRVILKKSRESVNERKKDIKGFMSSELRDKLRSYNAGENVRSEQSMNKTTDVIEKITALLNTSS